ncbi:fibronectin, partial [bacterium]|nr:fibronectin [bacterium]
EPAYLRRPAGTAFSQIRIVPNPYNIRAKDYQFGASAPDRIMFFNIPPKCVIKIFTESGELINTIEHTNSSGDESWNLITSSRQVIVSGLYIAYFEVLEDYIDPITGETMRKGESTYQKFIVIR